MPVSRLPSDLTSPSTIYHVHRHPDDIDDPPDYHTTIDRKMPREEQEEVAESVRSRVNERAQRRSYRSQKRARMLLIEARRYAPMLRVVADVYLPRDSGTRY